MSKKMLQAAAGNAGGDNLYVEDVFSTYLYTGNGTARDIENGIDLDGEGGLVWIKLRSTTTPYSFGHSLFDTERGALYDIHTNNTEASALYANSLTSFNSDGFSLGTDPSTGLVNYGTGTNTYASWTFRKAEKFFDVVTYTGNGATQNISHNLGSTPAVIIVKGTTTNNSWCVYSSALGNTKTLFLDLASGEITNTSIWNSTTPTDSVFSVGNVNNVNESGQTFVAYLFASDAGGFGDDGDESIIKCGSYNGTGGASATNVNLGFEPQFIFIMNSTYGTFNLMYDSMRGIVTGGNDAMLNPNSSYAENGAFGASDLIEVNATGFTITASGYDVSDRAGSTYVYMAIRRPMKTPESGTEVFAVGTNQEVPSATSGFYSGFPVDMAIKRIITASQPNYLFDRLRGGNALVTNTTAAESGFGAAEFDHQQGWYYDSDSANTNDYSWMFKRATGFMDVVAYTSTNSAINHNLGVSPELVIYKKRTTGPWYTMVATDGFGELSSTAAWGGAGNGSGLGPNLANATATTIKGAAFLSGSGVSMVTYLFATVAGVSKVGSYTGTGSNVDVNCGFSAGARFILIKRTDSTSHWYLWDSKRGIVAGNDPWIKLNNTNAQNSGQDDIDPLASGFTVTAAADVNQSGGNYIFLAIA